MITQKSQYKFVQPSDLEDVDISGDILPARIDRGDTPSMKAEDKAFLMEAIHERSSLGAIGGLATGALSYAEGFQITTPRGLVESFSYQHDFNILRKETIRDFRKAINDLIESNNGSSGKDRAYFIDPSGYSLIGKRYDGGDLPYVRSGNPKQYRDFISSVISSSGGRMLRKSQGELDMDDKSIKLSDMENIYTDVFNMRRVIVPVSFDPTINGVVTEDDVIDDVPEGETPKHTTRTDRMSFANYSYSGLYSFGRWETWRTSATTNVGLGRHSTWRNVGGPTIDSRYPTNIIVNGVWVVFSMNWSFDDTLNQHSAIYLRRFGCSNFRDGYAFCLNGTIIDNTYLCRVDYPSVNSKSLAATLFGEIGVSISDIKALRSQKMGHADMSAVDAFVDISYNFDTAR